MNATAHRARKADPALDTHGRRILCGALGATCGRIVAWDGAKHPVVVIPDGLTDAGTPGVYRWNSHSKDKIAADRPPDVRRDWRPAVYTAKQWKAVGPIRFARVPCVIPCPVNHPNDVTDAVLAPREVPY